MLNKHHQDDDGRQALIKNEVLPATLNNDYVGEEDAGGFVVDDATTGVAANFTAATLPHIDLNYDSIDYYDNAALQRAQVFISNAPLDYYKLTYIVFYLLGTATMAPWNFFITGEDYWMYKFRNTSLNDSSESQQELTPMQKSFTCDLTLTASISGTTFLILNAIYGQRISIKLKMFGTLFVILLIFIVTTAFVEVDTDKWQEQFFLLTLFTVVIINICSATMSGGIFGIAGLFPSEYMTALVSGQALGGIFTALAFISVLAFGATPKTTAFVYFIIGSVLILMSIITYVIMSRQAFFNYYLEGGDNYKIVTTTCTRTIDIGVALEPNVREVFGKVYVEAVCICVLYATTLSIYPGVSELMQSQNYGNGKAWNDIYYLPVVNYLFFNTGDYFGRIFAGSWQRPRSNPHTVLLLTFIRILYVPFILCSHTNLHNFLPTLVQSDSTFIIIIITFALSNGYLTNILLIMAPKCVLQHEKEVATSIMAASLSCGIAFGSMLSMIFVQLL